MQLQTKDGIKCDLCGTVYKNKFLYYSFDFREVDVINNFKNDIHRILSSKPINSLDVCSLCMDGIKKKIAIHYRATYNSTICDLTGLEMSGSYKFYYITVAKVDVEIGKTANVLVNDREVDLTISQSAYSDLVDKSLAVRSSNWTTT